MEPRIQYAKTEDGVSIAYWMIGEGPPLVRTSNIPFSHIQWMWQRNPGGERAIAEAIAERATYVQYDCRGSGSSTRDVADLSLEAHLTDLTAVVDRLALERFPLIAGAYAGPVAIAYAVRHPERLSHLILQNTYARYSDLLATPEGQTFHMLREKDWTIHTETGAHILMGWSAEAARLGAEFFRASISQEGALAAFRKIEEFDVTDLLPDVQIPTLVTHGGGPGIDWPPANLSRELAAQIPGAELVIAESLGAVFAAVGEFLGVEAEVPAFEPQAAISADVHTILFTDMEGSTTLADRLGDAGAQEVRRAHNEIVRAALQANSGSEIKHTGDGIMASFSTASAALDCAIAIQRGVAAYKDEHPDSPLGVYVGLNAGEPIAEDDDLFGTSVDLAARLVDHAQPGQIIASDVVRQLAAGKNFLFSDLGEAELRGFEDPVKLWELGWREGD